MKFHQKEIRLKPYSRGFHLISNELWQAIPEIKTISMGMLHVFIKHTSASLTINENADPTVRVDFENHTLSKVKVHEGVFSFIEEEGCEMVVFVNKKHWFFGSILSNPLVKNLGYDATVPILELNDIT